MQRVSIAVERAVRLGYGLPRAVDAAAASAILVLAWPALAVCALAIAVDSRGPVFYRQTRIGRHGRPFRILKFRTMHVARNGPLFTADDDQRITRVGRFLRAAKLDETPVLWNVLRGEMAMVGPRPEVPRYVDLKDDRWRRVLAARPGLTDPVTIRLRNEQAILGAIEGDRESFYRNVLVPWKLRGYIDFLATRTWRTDLRVLLETVRVVVFPDSVPAPRFI